MIKITDKQCDFKHSYFENNLYEKYIEINIQTIHIETYDVNICGNPSHIYNNNNKPMLLKIYAIENNKR